MKQDGVSSLAEAVDQVNEAAFFGRVLPEPKGLDLAAFIASRQGKPRAYRRMFAPSEQDWQGIRLFTGEEVTTRAAIAHILSEESMRALALLDVHDSSVRAAMESGREAALGFLGAAPEEVAGKYCCGQCSAALLRASSSGAYGLREDRVAAGIEAIRKHRRDGRWGIYPFYYTLLALSEIETDEAHQELGYARPACERALKGRREGRFHERRRALLERVLAR